MIDNQRFFLRILLPSLFAVLIFMAAIYLFVIPNYRENLMDGKRETIRELTNTAWSVMHKLHHMECDAFTRQQAQREAILIITDMRYGDELKDYFWITDTFPRMVMHPYRPMLNGKDLTNYRDPRGKNFFVDIVNVVRANGDGYVNYKWQWKDDSLTVVPKLSYVKAYKPWGWIVGTGIYIEDVERQISDLTRKVVWISVLITIVIAAVFAYLARRNYVAETERRNAQDRLNDTMERYKKLVEAATDGVCMVLGGEMVYCNPALLNILGFPQKSYENNDPRLIEVLRGLTEAIDKLFEKEHNISAGATEMRLEGHRGGSIDMLVSRSGFDMHGRHGAIYSVKDISSGKTGEPVPDLTLEKFKSIAGLLQIAMFRCTLGRNARFVEVNGRCLEILGYSSLAEMKALRVQELFYDSAERKEVIRKINDSAPVTQRYLRLKRRDGSILNAIVSLFPYTDETGGAAYCDGFIAELYDHTERIWPNTNENSIPPSAYLLQPAKKLQKRGLVCHLETPLQVASQLMTNEGCRFILVENNEGTIVGLVTQSDVVRRVLAVSGNLSDPVSSIMSSPLVTVPSDAIVIDALELMARHKILQIIVKDNVAKPFYIDLTSIAEQQIDAPDYTFSKILKARSIHELKVLFNRLPCNISNNIENGIHSQAVGKIIGRASDAITIKLIEMAVERLGAPPAPFVFLVLGSQGRMEQTLATDQDNAIVFNSNASNYNDCKAYFLGLGREISNNLNRVGFSLCKGGVMAMNEQWCMSIDEWETTISRWVSVPNPQEVLNISIFFDFRPVYGDFTLASRLQVHCKMVLKDNQVFLFNLLKSILGLKQTPIEMLAGSDLFDSKLPLLTITSIVRLWSLRFGVVARNSIERLNILNNLGTLQGGTAADFEQAVDFLLMLRMKHQIKQHKFNEPITNDIKVRNLSDFDKFTLKRISGTVADHLSRLAMEFKMV